MRHFFTEAHKLPTAWFDMRLNYQRSVATTSIVGHVLGLGDRHLSNILIHNMTGEVVHIDLGIAFDQVCHYAFDPSFVYTEAYV
jgi:ataxia telangiectasia mutated family protein